MDASRRYQMERWRRRGLCRVRGPSGASLQPTAERDSKPESPARPLNPLLLSCKRKGVELPWSPNAAADGLHRPRDQKGRNFGADDGEPSLPVVVLTGQHVRPAMHICCLESAGQRLLEGGGRGARVPGGSTTRCPGPGSAIAESPSTTELGAARVCAASLVVFCVCSSARVFHDSGGLGV